jgi:hypothetical protein
MRLRDLLDFVVPAALGVAAAAHPVGARALSGVTAGVNIMAARNERQRQEERDQQLREGLGGLRLSEILEPEEATAYQALIAASPTAGATALLPRLSERARIRREERALAPFATRPTITRDVEIPGGVAQPETTQTAYGEFVPQHHVTEPAFPAATFVDPVQGRTERVAMPAPFVTEDRPAFRFPDVPTEAAAYTRRDTVPLEQGGIDEQIRALRDRRAKYEGTLGGLTGSRLAAGERAVKRLDEQITRLEGRATAAQVNRRAAELVRTSGMDIRAARQQAQAEALEQTGTVAPGFRETLPDKPERLTEVDLALAATDGDPAQAISILRQRGQTQVDLALQASGGDPAKALRLLREPKTHTQAFTDATGQRIVAVLDDQGVVRSRVNLGKTNQDVQFNLGKTRYELALRAQGKAVETPSVQALSPQEAARVLQDINRSDFLTQLLTGGLDGTRPPAPRTPQAEADAYLEGKR